MKFTKPKFIKASALDELKVLILAACGIGALIGLFSNKPLIGVAFVLAGLIIEKTIK